ncbi:MAG: hypothetical protein A3H91_07895 [Gammaproteobacteria bacterium RIFCSPLOWO2_02_FULL_61_13]|nr:MAG: hypothetical protein A3H91_07895 [Gammaproteobacteria bacterium RIFCSPLOWO2_02_FULL_61_13]
MRERSRDRDVYDQIVSGQQAERLRSRTGRVVVRGKGNPWILDRQGLVRHYLTPSRYTGEPVDTALDGWIVFVQEVGKHSGKHRHQGGLVIYVLEGEGHSIVDGERHDWEAEDVINVPIRSNGVTLQHFNLDRREPALLICADLNLADFLGLDRGSVFEQLEAAPLAAP